MYQGQILNPSPTCVLPLPLGGGGFGEDPLLNPPLPLGGEDIEALDYSSVSCLEIKYHLVDSTKNILKMPIPIKISQLPIPKGTVCKIV